MLSYTHFTHDERISLHNFLKEGLGIREIARRLGRDPSTICREDSNAETQQQLKGLPSPARSGSDDQPPKTATPRRLKAGHSAV